MKTFQMVTARFAVSAALALAAQAFLAPHASAQAACECVTYVYRAKLLTGNYGNAKDWGPYLLSKGYSVSDTPKVNRIAVMQPGFGGWANPQFGHVGIVSDAVFSGNQYRLRIKGANQGSNNMFTEYNCNNVTSRWWGGDAVWYAIGAVGVKYYYKAPEPL